MPGSDGGATLLFMHIGKSGGMSLREAIRAAVPAEQRVFIYDPADNPGALTSDQVAALPEPDRRRLRVVMGHFFFGLHELLPQPSRYVTMVRDPVGRVASMWAFYNRHYPALTAGLTLDQWATASRNLQTDNEMVRMIAGLPSAPYGTIGNADLERAVANIEHAFEDVLVFERYAESTRRLTRLLNIPLPPVERLNAAPARTRLDPAVYARIAEANRFDMWLYDYCVRRFGRHFS
jgi:hypothetical protein